MKQLVIIGAGGHGRVAADVAEKCGDYESILFLDDAENISLQKYKIAGKLCDISSHISDSSFFVAIGDNLIRQKVLERLAENGAAVATLIHPAAVIGTQVQIGIGSIIMAGAVVNTGTAIGKGTILNTCSSVDHDSVIEDYVHIAVGAHLAGAVRIGQRTIVGAGATLINNIEICSDCTIGAGAVVIKNITAAGTYVGVPARRV